MEKLAQQSAWGTNLVWAHPFIVTGVLSSLFILSYFIIPHLRSPLRRYPGPFLARYTNLWRMYHSSRGNIHLVVEKLHQKYGPIVRLGPNVLDIDYPEMIKTVFSTKDDWKKTDFYLPSSALVDGHLVFNMFSQVDKKIHDREKKPVAKYYTPNSVATMEGPHIDKMVKQLCDELDSRYASDPKTFSGPVNLGEWILYYSWDAIGQVTFSQPIGYLKNGRDFDGTLRTAEKALDYFAWVSSMPWLDRFFDKNPIMHIGPPGFGAVTGTCIHHLVNRYQGADKEHHDPANPDYLDKFIEARKEDPELVTDQQIMSWLMANIIAGADTTALSIRSIIYFCLKNPKVWQRLREELAVAGMTPEKCPLPYKEVRALPYLDAVIKEALRVLPGVTMGLQRYVPAGGQELPDGSFVPEGVALSFNPYILSRNREVVGEDATEFKPERWFQAEGEPADYFRDRIQRMNNADLGFGGGGRSCLGKQLGLVQVYKVVATLAVSYDIELVHPDKEWKVINSFFPRQEGLEVRLRKRV